MKLPKQSLRGFGSSTLMRRFICWVTWAVLTCHTYVAVTIQTFATLSLPHCNLGMHSRRTEQCHFRKVPTPSCKPISRNGLQQLSGLVASFWYALNQMFGCSVLFRKATVPQQIRVQVASTRHGLQTSP